jgi:hypothetical protein
LSSLVGNTGFEPATSWPPVTAKTVFYSAKIQQFHW